MAPFFKRNKKTTIAELEEYYATKNKNRPVMAWFMAFLSLVITVVVLVGIFLASRWVYRTIVGNDNATTTTVSTEPGTVALPTFDSDTESSVGISFEDSTSDNDSDLVYGNTGPSRSGESNSGGVVDDGAAVIDRSSETTASANTENTNNVGSTNSNNDAETTELPDTGAGESVLIAMVVVALAGYFFSRSRQLR